MKEEGFFPKERKKRSCGCEAMVVFFIILFIAGAFLIWRLYQRLNSSSQNQNRVTFSSEDLSSFNNKFTNLNQTSRVEITEAELSAYLSELVSKNNYVFKNPYALIEPKGITILGETWPKGQAKITIFPQVIDGHLKFNLVDSNLPDLVVNPILDKISSELESKIVQGKIKMTDLELTDGKMIIKVTSGG